MKRYLRLIVPLFALFAAAPAALHAVDFLSLDACPPAAPGGFCYKAKAVLSPDAQWFAYTDETAYAPAYEYYPDIVVQSRDGSEKYIIQTFVSDVNYSPAWSPDGRSIAFISSPYNSFEDHGLWIVELAARSIKEGYRHIVVGGQIANPSWSLDGNFIAYERQGQGIWMVSSMGGIAVQVVTSGQSPSWGPDNTMVFERDGDLWVRNSLGEINRLAETASEELQPAWSPSGEWIAYSSNQTGNWDIWVIAPTGGTPVQVTSDMLKATSPSWSGDGRALMFLTLEGPDTIWLATDLPDFTTSVESRSWGQVKKLFR